MSEHPNPAIPAKPAGRMAAAEAMLRIAWAADRKRSVLAFGLFGLQALASSLFAWWLKLFIDAAQTADAAGLALATTGLATSLAGNTALSRAANQVLLALRERAHNLVERRMIEVVGHTPTLEIHETPEHLTQVEVLDREAWQFGEAVPSLVNLFGTSVRVITTALLLASVDPLLLFLPLFGVPALLLSSKASHLYHVGDDLAAEALRRSEHLYDLVTRADAAKEVRLFRLGPELTARFHAAYAELIGIYRSVAIRAEAIGLTARIFFLLGYFAAIILVVRQTVTGQASLGDVALTAVLAGQVLSLLAGSAELLQSAWQSLAIAGRYVRLQTISRQARARITAAPDAVPNRLTNGIRLDHVSYSYPSATHDALHDINLHVPAGATIAIVGDNGAGKTTLVKLLAGLYHPTRGHISVDNIDLASLDPDQWRQRISAGFQDHARFEFPIREAVGIGDLTAIDNPNAVHSALNRAGASDLLDTLPRGIDTQLGTNWNNGVELSGGQWQKIAISRAMMRTRPLLLLLDEPTAALDADTEHRLFQQWSTAAHDLRQATGAITVLVSHRFSTVRMADLIVVIDHGHISETGTHQELLDRRGLYAELFELQARSYL